VTGVLAAIGIGTACSNQGEGEVCNILNGSDDCQTDNGLSCFRASDLNNVTSDRCCPTDRSQATHPACTTPIVISGSSDAAAPADTGPGSVTQDAQVAETGSGTDAADAADTADAPDQ
jgi:hypothetical protein